MAGELADRFGPIPDPANNLLYQLRVKALALKAGYAAVTTEAGQIKIRIPELSIRIGSTFNVTWAIQYA